MIFDSDEMSIIGDFRFDYEHAEIEYENAFSILVFRLHIIRTHIPISSHELPSLPKTGRKNQGSGNVSDLNIENRTRTQSRTRSPI